MHNNCMILSAAFALPSQKVDNEFFIEHFEKKGTDIRGLLRATGRNSRYISNSLQETMLTLGYGAAGEALERAYIRPSQLNMIVCSSGTPEYLTPTNALIMHSMFEAGQKCMVYDLNANCAGMLAGFEQIARSMRDNPNIKYALLIGSDLLNRYADYTEVFTYSNFADSACAVVLENVFNTERGFMDSDFYTNSSNQDKILFPSKGLSNVIHGKGITVQDKLIKWTNFELKGAFYSAKISIEELLFKNNITKKQIKKYFVSQFARSNIERLCEDLDEDMDKFVYVGDEFGYTGTTSPFMAFAKSYESKELSAGDYIMFWTVGAGTTCLAVLYQY